LRRRELSVPAARVVVDHDPSDGGLHFPPGFDPGRYRPTVRLTTGAARVFAGVLPLRCYEIGFGFAREIGLRFPLMACLASSITFS
jgi:hypothetical protein